MSRVSATVLGLACVLAGYLLAGMRVNAASIDGSQQRSLPYTMHEGDHVTLMFVAGSMPNGITSAECTVETTSAPWVRCKPSEEKSELWYDLTRVSVVRRAIK